MSNYIGDFVSSYQVYHDFNTFQSNGLLASLVGSVAIYRSNDSVAGTIGASCSFPYNSITGYNRVTIDTSNAWYTKFTDYNVFLAGGIAGTATLNNYNLFSFSIENRNANNTSIASIYDRVNAIPTGSIDYTQVADSVWTATKAAYIDTEISSRLSTIYYTDTIGVGTGSVLKVYTVTDSVSNAGIPGVLCNFTSDEDGLDSVAVGYTNDQGNVVVSLVSGDYYVWRTHSSYTFVNPDHEVV